MKQCTTSVDGDASGNLSGRRGRLDGRRGRLRCAAWCGRGGEWGEASVEGGGVRHRGEVGRGLGPGGRLIEGEGGRGRGRGGRRIGG